MIEAKSFLGQAKELMQRDSVAEVDVRTAISRAYYAAYHVANTFHEHLPSPGISPQREYGMHEELIYRLTNPSVRDDGQRVLSKKIGFILKTLKTRRTEADYRLFLNILPEMAELQIAEAENLVKLAG